MSLNLSNFFNIPGYDKELILFIKYILTIMNCCEKVIFFSSLDIRSKSGIGYLYLIRDKYDHYHYSEIPVHFKVTINKFHRLNIKNWLYWLEELNNLLELQFRKHSLYLIINKFLKEERSYFKKSENDIKDIKEKFPGFEKEMIEPWFLYKYNLCGELDEETMSVFTNNFKIILKQITQKSQISDFIFRTFKKYVDHIENAINDNDLIKIKDISNHFKNDIHSYIDKKFSFVQTKDIDYYKWLISFYELFCECDMVEYNLSQRVAKLNLIFQLGYEHEQEKKNIKYKLLTCKDIENIKETDISTLKVDKSKEVHCIFRGDYLKNL
jgi:hypothetical protein